MTDFDRSRYLTIPFKFLKPQDVHDYWQDVIDADTLKHRMANVVDPTMKDVTEMLTTSGELNHYTVDLASGKLVGEVLVTPLIGKMGTIHFSAHPSLQFARSIQLGRVVTDDVLNVWKDGDDLAQPYLMSLMGVTPVRYRVACIFAIKVGFKRVMEIAGGCFYEGKPARALLSIKQSINTN